MTENEKIVSRITVLLFTLFLGGFCAAFLILPDLDFSEEENRSLRTFPSFSVQKLFSGSYGEEINDYFADQFPLRDAFVGIKGVAEIVSGKGENDGVLLGPGGQLAKRMFDAKCADGSTFTDTDVYDMAHLDAAAEGILRAGARSPVPFTVLLTGRTLDVAASAFSYPSDIGDSMRALLHEQLDGKVAYLDTVPMFREKFNAGEAVYYKTDHHWTTLGAYNAYCELMRSFGMESEIIPGSAYQKVVASESFRGTAWSAGGMKFVPAEMLELWYLGNESSFTVTADGKQLDGFYSTRYLAGKDKYSVFLDGTHDVVTVRKKTGEKRPTLVVFRDSFGSSLAPFLAQHFDLVLLNLSSARTDFTDVTSYAAKYGADRVLIVYTLENVVTSDRMNRLR